MSKCNILVMSCHGSYSLYDLYNFSNHLSEKESEKERAVVLFFNCILANMDMFAFCVLMSLPQGVMG